MNEDVPEKMFVLPLIGTPEAIAVQPEEEIDFGQNSDILERARIAPYSVIETPVITLYRTDSAFSVILNKKGAEVKLAAEF